MPTASSIQVVNDANGTAYAFLEDNGLLWQCQWNAAAQRWDRGQVVPGAYGGEKLQALYLKNLWPTSDSSGNNPGTAAGVVLAYRVGEGSSSQVLATFGRWTSEGQLQWSAPAALSTPAVEVQAFALVPGEASTAAEGQGQSTFSLVVQLQQPQPPAISTLEQLAQTPEDQLQTALEQLASASRPDTDLYRNSYRIAPGASSTSAPGLQTYAGSDDSGQPTWSHTATLTPAPQESSPAGSPVLLGGNTQLTRSQLAAPPPPALPGKLASGGGMIANTDQFSLAAAEPQGSNGGNGFFYASFVGKNKKNWFITNENTRRWSWGGLSRDRLTRGWRNISQQDSLKGDWVFKGAFGKSTFSSSSTFTYSTARLQRSTRNLAIKRRLSGADPNPDFLSYTRVLLQSEIGGAGFVGTQYLYQDGQKKLTSAQTKEGASIDYNRRSVYKNVENGTLRFSLYEGFGYAFDQSLSNSAGLPGWLSTVGKVPGWTKPVLGITSFGDSLVSNRDKLRYFKGAGFLPGYKVPGNSNFSKVLNILSTVVGVSTALLGPVLAIGQGIRSSDEESRESGFSNFTRFTAGGLWHGVIGLQGAVANNLNVNAFGGGNAGSTWEDRFLFNFGIALPLGIYLPLISYTDVFGSGAGLASGSEGEGAAASVDATAAGTPQKSAFISAPDGAAYPFSYAPQSADNSYFAPDASGGPSNPYLLGASTQPLQLLTLQPYTGAINDGSSGSGPLTLVNPGLGLVDGSYSDVPILGLALTGGSAAFARASFTVAGGSIAATSLQITAGGSSIGLPETQPGSGIYALVLDVFSTGIATPPAGDFSGNPLANLPLLTVDSSRADSPLSARPIQRVSSVPVPAGSQTSGVVYPEYDPTTQTTSAPASNNNGAYTYQAVPVTLLDAGVALPLLNPGPVTSTVVLSGGTIQRVDLEQPLLFSGSSFAASTSAASDSSYSVQLTLPAAVVASLPAGTAAPSFAVSPRSQAYNNVVAEEEFSAQSGALNSAVYLTAGASDQLPLLRQMAGWPVQNRVTYSTLSDDGATSTWVLNRLKQTQPGSRENAAPIAPPTLEQVYRDQATVFSAASHPTAVTIAGPQGAAYSGGTFVAWVEASELVIPATSADGSSNYQAFLQALYGNQRLNFRILQADGSWATPNLEDLYSPTGAVISQLQGFQVTGLSPSSWFPGGEATLLVWDELSIDAIQDVQPAVGAGASIPSALKAGWINPAAVSFQWNDLFSFSDASGQTVSSIQTIPWDASTAVGLTIGDISAGSLPVVATDGSASSTAVINFSQTVRTPYRQSVLNDQPSLYLELGALESGLNSINIGTNQDPATTSTFASETGLNFTIAGALPKSQAAAVQNLDGTGVLSTGLGTLNAPNLLIARNIPTQLAVFSGSISGTTLTVSSLSAGQPRVGDGLSGAGVLAGTTIAAILNADPLTGLGTYSVNQSQNFAAITLQALPEAAGLLSFSGAIDGTTLTVTALSEGSLNVGDVVAGQGVLPGTRITAVLSPFDPATGQGSYSVDRSQSLASSALVAAPPVPSDPYTIEFWAQLQPGSNPEGAGLVALGQPSAAAIGPAQLPEGWLLGASFVVDRITFQQAAGQGLITAIPNGQDANATYGWGWAVVATGADTTAMGGNGGNNLYSNALQINNLISGVTLAGVNRFLANYGVSASELIGIDGSTAATMASVPFTELQFNAFLDSSNNNLPTSNLNGIAVDTTTAVLNDGLLLAADVAENSDLSKLFTSLWNYQEQTGEAKVSFDLAPGSSNATTAPSPSSNEQYSGYALEFSLLNGPAVSVNDLGQLVLDVAPGVSLTSSQGVDLRDGLWHYIAASYLPEYASDTVLGPNGTPVQPPTLNGTATLVVDNQVVGSSPVRAAYAAGNLSDQALLLAGNAAGAIDQFALYGKALTTSTPPLGETGLWPAATANEALALWGAAGVVVPGQTPDQGSIPSALTSHWAARDVNPNGAELATYSTVYDPSSHSWSAVSTLNPQLAPQPTTPSATAPGSLQNDLVIAVPSSSWTSSGWNETIGGSASAKAGVFFNPANQQLQTVTVTLTDTTTGTSTTITLNSNQVLIGSQTLQSLQPLANGTSLNYTVLSESPAFSLLIPRNQIKNPADSYTATYSFSFAGDTVGDTSVSNATPVPVNGFASSVASSGLSGSTVQSTLTKRSTALATAQVLEQAPLQLETIDSGEVFQSRPTAATSNNKALSPTPESFGQSQVFGSFTDSSGNTNGWLAIAQPSTLNSGRDPAGCVWIQYTGQSNSGMPSSDPAQAPSTWLNALANSNFVPDSVNLPLLGDALYPNSSGGLLIQADPTKGWGQQLGQTMLVADVNDDGIDDLVLAAPAANGGGAVYIIDGSWIQANLTSTSGETILNLANPNAYGDDVVTVLIQDPQAVDSSGIRYDISVAGFGTALAFDSGTNTLWIGAPNVLQQRNPDSSNLLSSLVPAGAIYRYNDGSPIPLTPVYYGSSGTAIVPGAAGGSTTEYWGSQLGTAIAVDPSGNLAVSAPGVLASLAYSGTEPVQKQATEGKTITTPYGDGALVQIELPDASGNVSSLKGSSNPYLQPVVKQNTKTKSTLATDESRYMQTLKSLQSVQIADATLFNNQAYQAAAVGAVYVLPAIATNPTTSNTPTLSGGTLPGGGYTLYGANPWNVLGPSGFGSSLAFADLVNKNGTPMLAIGADQAGGSGALYLVDTSQSFSDPSGWVADINLGSRQYLAHLASSFTLYGAASADNFGNGLVNLGDVNGDGYGDLLIQAFNASEGAGNGYVLFGSDQFNSSSTSSINSLTINNPAAGNVAAATIGQMTRADGSTFTASILNEVGYGPGAFTGLGSFGPGDVNGDGLPDILLGAGADSSAYLTYGQSYLESISNLQLQKLTSNTGYRLEGLASTTQGSLRSVGDFNDDGYGDFVSIQPGDLYTTVRLELGTNTQEILADYLYAYYSFTVANGTEVLGAGDINGDGYADIGLFLQQNLSSTDAGAGSTTGILFGRSSDQLPIGSGFGLQAPVNPSGSTPLAPLPSLPSNNLPTPYGTAAPSLIADGSNLYAVAAGTASFDAATGTLYFAQSSDGGNSWTSWTDISSSWNLQPSMPEAGFSGPSLAFFNGRLYLAFQEFTDDGATSNLALTSWDPNSGSSGPWSSPIQMTSSSDGTQFTSKAQPALVNLGTSLGVYWTDRDLNYLSGSSSTNPQQAGSWLSPVAQQQRVRQADNTVSFETIYIHGAPSVAVFGDQLVMAAVGYYNTDSVLAYALSETGQSWELASSFNADLAYNLDTSPNLVSTDTGLALTYAANRESLYLQRLDLISSDGLLLEGDLNWQQTILPGLNTNLQPTLVNASGTLLLSTTAGTGAQAQLSLSAVPVLSNPDSTIWINSTVQLPDGQGGWTVQQQSGGASGLTSAQTGSSLSAIGDLNNDGYADLLVSANNVLLNPGSDPSVATQATGLRLITGAASSGQILSGNDATASSQNVQVAPAFGLNSSTPVASLNGTINRAPQVGLTGTDLSSGQVAATSSAANWTWSPVAAGQSPFNPSLASDGSTITMAILGEDSKFYWTSSSDGAQTWGQWQELPTSVVSYNAPTIAVVNQELFLVFIGEDTDFYITQLTDAATNQWADMTELPNQEGDQALGAVAISEAVNSQAGLAIYYPAANGSGDIYRTWSATPLDADSWSVSQLTGQTCFGPLAATSFNNQTYLAFQSGTPASPETALQIISNSDPASASDWSTIYTGTANSLQGVGLTSSSEGLLLNTTNAGQQQVQLIKPPTGGGGGGAWSATVDLKEASLSLRSPTATCLALPPAGPDSPTPVLLAQVDGKGSVLSSVVEPGHGLDSGNAAQFATAFIATAGNLASAQQLFSPAAIPLSERLGLGLGFGELALNTGGTYGDLNADGNLDALVGDPTVAFGVNGISWHVWSIRVAGDVNGNGTDDVLLSLSPVEVPQNAMGQPQNLQAVLVDGALFEVDQTTNSFSLQNLRRGLDPGVGATSISLQGQNQQAPTLQYWIQGIQTFEGSTINNGRIVQWSNLSTAPYQFDVARPYAANYATATDDQGSGYLLALSSSGLAIQSLDPGTQQVVKLGSANTSMFCPAAGGSYSPYDPDVNSMASAAIYGGKLYFATRSGEQIYLSSIDLDALRQGGISQADNWSSYALPSGYEAIAPPALVNEGDQLSLYFANPSYGIRVASATDPGSGERAWGAILQGAFSVGQSSAITDASGQALEVSPGYPSLAASRFQGRTLLLRSTTMDGDSPTLWQQPSQEGTAWTAIKSNVSIYPPTNGQYFWLNANATQVFATLWTLQDMEGQGFENEDNQSTIIVWGNENLQDTYTINESYTGETAGSTWVQPFAGVMAGSQLSLIVQKEDTEQNSTTQFPGTWTQVDAPSLAGYSIDGNIDVNGDGFMDMLVSDPSNPTTGLANQYVLFGGDYLNIASQVGTPGNDVMLGTPLADVIYTIQGADQVSSNGGTDVIVTGAGDDAISIQNNAFIRIDAGSGFDALLLKGQANQSYDFCLNISSPAYFAGTKLRDIELISSIDYGANQLSFDAAAVNAINTDRVLFLTPDASDSITLSTEFNRNASFDTSLGGTLWSAYAAAPASATPASSNPALVYVAVPTGQTAGWLSTNVSLTDTPAAAPASALRAAAPAGTAASDPPSVLPTTSPIADTRAFGDGLTLLAYRSDPASGVARFAIERSDTIKRQVVLYASSSANGSAEPGSHYTAVAGLLVFEPGQTSHEVTVAIDSVAFARLGSGSLSLQVEELQDQGQTSLHLLITPTAATAAAALQPVLSSFELSAAENATSAILSFRADSTSGNPDSLQLTVSQRDRADSDGSLNSQNLQILDFGTPTTYPISSISDPVPLDHDGRKNNQVGSRLKLNFTPASGEPFVSILGPAPVLEQTVQQVGTDQIRFQQDGPLTSWRSDSGPGLLTFALQAGSTSQTLLTAASGGSFGSIDPTRALDNSPGGGWQGSEGLAVGSRSITTVANLSAQAWTPTATRDGVALNLQDISINGNQVTARFQGGVSVEFWQASGTAPSLVPIAPAVEVKRLAGYNNTIGFYSVDSITGLVDGRSPGEAGYLQAALARSEAEKLLLTAADLPAFGESATFNALPLNSQKSYGVLVLQNGDRNTLFSSFSAANPGGETQMLRLGSDPSSYVLGIEDLAVASGRSDRDFNDNILTINGVSLGLF